MKNANITRPFNVKHAKAGAAFATGCGKEVKILKWNGRNADFPLIGIVGENDEACQWSKTGESKGGEYLDLVMIPLGECEGRPVFTGDVVIVSGREFTITPVLRVFTSCTWPK